MKKSKNIRIPKALAVCLAAAVPAVGAGAVATPATLASTGSHSAQTRTVSASSAASSGRRSCSLPKNPNSRARYLQFVTFHMSCTSGKTIAAAHYRCRTKNGLRGRCSEKTKILGYNCHESRLNNKGYFDSRVDCTRGNRAAVWVYRQR